MRKNYKLTIAYDGTRYLGWQDNNSGPSIEGSLCGAIGRILQETITLQAASRTDGGVHASGQVVNFITEKEILCITKFQRSINALLPCDISLRSMEAVPLDFHPTVQCKMKEYHYTVSFCSIQLPENRLYSWHYPYPLDLVKMRRAALYFIGRHDFIAFSNKKISEEYTTTVREVQRLDIIELPNEQLRFEIEGAHFLYKMVRNIVGSIVYIGCNKVDSDLIPHILKTRDRKQAGVTAPSHGLCLKKIIYT